MQVLLCGTHYGSTYLQALWQHPQGLRLGGILSRGSERSRQLARQLSVPHYAAPEEIPARAVDGAIVAVGSGGAELATRLLERGIPVLAEHPMEPGELEQVLAVAAKAGKTFHLNSHFADLETIAPFIQHVVELRRHSPLLFLSAHFNLRTAFSLLDILGRALGTLENFSVLPPAAAPEDPPAAFAALPAAIGGVSATLLCQRFVSTLDDGSATLLGHQITAGFSSGNVVLGEAFGPVLWQTRLGPSVPAHLPWWAAVGPPAEQAGNPQSGIRQRANVLALSRLAQQMAGGAAPPMQSPAHLLGVARAWRAILDALGPPQLGHYPAA